MDTTLHILETSLADCPGILPVPLPGPAVLPAKVLQASALTGAQGGCPTPAAKQNHFVPHPRPGLCLKGRGEIGEIPERSQGK